MGLGLQWEATCSSLISIHIPKSTKFASSFACASSLQKPAASSSFVAFSIRKEKMKL
jgi:hypothetical protein